MQKKMKRIAALTAGLAGILVMTSCGDKVTYDEKSFTYNTYLSTKPTNWNVHDWETNDESYIPTFTEIGFYDCILNANKDGYEFVTEMASEFPQKLALEDVEDSEGDITEKYGYPGNVGEGMIWNIKLNEKATWQDGTPIKAEDYVESMKRQLDPLMINFRADSYYAANFVIANAEKYYKSNRRTVEALYPYINLDDGSFNSDAVASNQIYYVNLGRYTPYVNSVFSNASSDTTFYDVLNQIGDQTTDMNVKLATQRIIDAFCYYGLHHVEHKNDEHAKDWAEAEKPSDVKSDMMNYDMNINHLDQKATQVYVRKEVNNSSVAPENQILYSKSMLIEDLNKFVSYQNKKTYKNAYLLPLFGQVKNEEFSDFGKVGIKAMDDYTLRLYLGQSISLLDLKFALTGNWLVNVKRYDELKTTSSSGLVSTAYATKNVSNYMAYGPYKLTRYEEGKSFFISRNENWYGYTDGKHEGQYQMTGISTTIIESHDTARLEFEKGNLDDFSMDANDMRTYGNSSRMTTVPESYTQKISFNSSRAKLLSMQKAGNNINKTILANDKFRKGLSLALNRNSFAADTTAGSKAFTGLLNELYLTDVEIGEVYRDTPQGKSVYNKVYGTLGGDPYSDNYQPQALAENQNGYNMKMATKYVEEAIREELADEREGHLVNNNVIELEIRVYNEESNTTKLMTQFINTAFSNVIQNAVAEINKTDSDKKSITFSLRTQQDEDYYNTAKAGNYDMIFSTWGGAAINPYGLMQVYLDPEFESTCEYGFKGMQNMETLAIDLDGDGEIDEATEVKTYNNWYKDITENIKEPDLDGIDRDAEENAALVTKYNEIHNQRVTILAGVEAGILNRFEAVPLVARGDSSLTSFKVENATKTYINLVGYGGVRFMKFNYNDKTWHEFINSKSYNKTLYES